MRVWAGTGMAAVEGTIQSRVLSSWVTSQVLGRSTCWIPRKSVQYNSAQIHSVFSHGLRLGA